MTPKQELISKLSDGYSKQSEATNKFWLVLIVASTIGLVGRPDKDNFIDLPFTLGKVYAIDFYLINIILLSGIVIAFSSAMIQTIRSRMLIQKAIDDLCDSEKYVGKVHLQDFFDSISTPTYSRVAPIAQFIAGKNQFFSDPKPSKRSRQISRGVYLIFKYSTFAFLYVIPIWSLVQCWINKTNSTGIGTIYVPDFLLIILMFLAFSSIAILLVGDIQQITRASKKIGN